MKTLHSNHGAGCQATACIRPRNVKTLRPCLLSPAQLNQFRGSSNVQRLHQGGTIPSHRHLRRVVASDTAAREALVQSIRPQGPELIAILKKACDAPGSVPTSQLLKAVVGVEKLKIEPGQDWWQKLSRHKWTIVYTASSKEVQAARKGKSAGSGIYFPLIACQWFDDTDSSFENGVFLPNIAHLSFRGPCAMKGRQLTFNVKTMYLGIGPYRWGIPINGKAKPIDQETPESARKLPFFLWGYVDDNMLVARGRGGGLALYKRADAEFLLSTGIVNVFKS